MNSARWPKVPGVVDLLVAHPALIKRPVIEDGDAIYVGWGDDVAMKFK